MQKVFDSIEKKIKVTSLEIIVTGTKDKPYFEIKYKEVGKEDYHIGYSSYDLNKVLDWKERDFEIVNQVKFNEKLLNGSGWIPCSERLPSDCAIHEVTAKFSNGKSYTEFAYYDEAREEWWKFDDDGLVNVIAWKESSEPYKAESEE